MNDSRLLCNTSVHLRRERLEQPKKLKTTDNARLYLEESSGRIEVLHHQMTHAQEVLLTQKS